MLLGHRQPPLSRLSAKSCPVIAAVARGDRDAARRLRTGFSKRLADARLPASRLPAPSARAIADETPPLQGAEAVLLGGTDLFLAFAGQDCGFPVIDCAEIHVEALYRRSESGESNYQSPRAHRDYAQ
jgi:hypothetical protein